MTIHDTSRPRIAVDAMSGNRGQSEIILGAVQGAREHNIDLILIGLEGNIKNELAALSTGDVFIQIIDAPEIIRENEPAALAVGRKPGSTIAIGARLLKEGRADAFVSAGPMAALTVAGMSYLGALPGIDRPIIGGPFLGLTPKTVIVDVGGNTGSQPYHYVNYAVAGSVYARLFLNISNPTVGLLNIGNSADTGVLEEADDLLSKCGVNFIGNVEGHDITDGKADVVVCDGFTGNVLLKFTEGLGYHLHEWLVQQLKAKLSSEDLEQIGRQLYDLLTPKIGVEGGPLLGLNGIICKAHAASSAGQIAGMVKLAKTAFETGLAMQLRLELQKAQMKMTGR